MHLLEFAATQHAFHNHLGTIRAQTLFHGKVCSRPFTYGIEKRLSSTWKLLETTQNFKFCFGHHEMLSGRLLIKAVATLEHKSMVKNANENSKHNNLKLGVDNSNPTVQLECSSEDYVEMDDRERLRRIRISKANKGNTPWNKGKKHSPETIQRIRERTKLAMQNTKVKMKLVNLGHAQSEETKKKIGVGVRIGCQKRRQKQLVQETCYFEWQNLIAEAARQGYDGEEEMQWNLYNLLDEKLREEWLENVERRKTMPRPKGNKRAPKSIEQRRKISEAIYRKWADPGYRDRVCCALAKHHGIPPGTERKPRRRPSGTTQSAGSKSVKKTLNDENTWIKIQKQLLGKRKAPLYKDPLARSKLEMIKNIRAQRATSETKKMEAVERARLLIAEAEKAADALEIAATKSPIAHASLIETRKLIAQAVQSLESIEADHPTSDREVSVKADELSSQANKEIYSGNGIFSEIKGLKINGTKTFATIKGDEEEGFDFSKSTLQDTLNVEEKLIPRSSNGYGLSPFSFENLSEHAGQEQVQPNAESARENKPQSSRGKEETPSNSTVVTKKWVCGRLVEITEGA